MRVPRLFSKSHEQRSRRRQSGQAVLEYILLLTIVIGVMGYFVSRMTANFDKTTASYGGSVEKQLRTGSAPATIWNK